jgi:hypothetical protein
LTVLVSCITSIAIRADVRCWSTYESQWINVTLFDARRNLHLGEARPLALDDAAAVEVADVLGLRVVGP